MYRICTMMALLSGELCQENNHMKGVLKALVSLTPVVAACYLLSTLKGAAALLLMLSACLAWCAWTTISERRKLAVSNFDGDFTIDVPSNVVNTVTEPPREFLNVVRKIDPSKEQNWPSGNVESRRPELRVQNSGAMGSAGSTVRPFPIHKLSR